MRFARENATRNGFGEEQVACFEGSIESYVPAQPYDLILANPPFVPTPDAIPGTLTSQAGSEGNDLGDVLLRRLDALLAPQGEAFVYLFQFLREGRPLVADSIERWVVERDVELTPTQQRPISAGAYFEAYLELFPDAADAIQRWRDDLVGRHGAALTLDHFVVHVGAQRSGPTRWTIHDDLEAKFGAGLRLTFRDDREMALGRAFENLVPK